MTNLSTKSSNNNNERESAIYNNVRTVMTKITEITEEEVLFTNWYDVGSYLRFSECYHNSYADKTKTKPICRNKVLF